MYPSSEIEVKNVQKEIMNHKDRLEAFVTIHTAARLILSPWGSVLDPGTQNECEYLDEPENTDVVRFICNQ